MAVKRRNGEGKPKLKARGKAGKARTAAARRISVPVADFFSHDHGHFAMYAIFVCCLFYAVALGIHQPGFGYRQADAVIIAGEGCPARQAFEPAFAYGNRVVLPGVHWQRYSLDANFEGSGTASRVRIEEAGTALNITSLKVDGEAVCSPCLAGKPYPLPQSDSSGGLSLSLQVSGEGIDRETFGKNGGGLAFFQEQTRTKTIEPIVISLDGEWRAKIDRSMPSSFYGVDAPFHIDRIPVLARYLAAGKWPWEYYTFLSAIPPALIYLAFGVTQQYAYKAYEILLFFVPIVLFWLFSRKLSRNRDTSFLFASLAYLFIPAVGYPTGGPELFLYGMTAHTLATYFSLFFFLSAYEFAFEGKRHGAALAVLFFALAVLSNQRIGFALAVMLAIMLAWLFWKKRFLHAALFGVACAASVAWFVLPYLQGADLAGYSALGGISVSAARGSPLGLFFQTGFLAFPVLFAIGAAYVIANKEKFALALLGCAAAVFALSTSEQVNAVFPFVDGLRLLPSFVLPGMFVAGVGAGALLKRTVEWAVLAGRKAGMDRTTVAGGLALALLAPAAMMFFVFTTATVGQYKNEAYSPHALVDYVSQERALRAIGGERHAFVFSGDVSQYPVAARLALAESVDYVNVSSLAERMRSAGLRYVILGNEKTIYAPGEKPRWEEYDELSASPLFERMPSYGYAALFRLKGARPAEPVPDDKDFVLATFPSKYGYEFWLFLACALAVAVSLAALNRLR
ncbi:MAG: hypothetical protein QW568_02670 [Candidatus Anstonellaceae archaeon]